MPKRIVSQVEERGTHDVDSLESLLGDNFASLRGGIPPEVTKALDLSGGNQLEWTVGKNEKAIVGRRQ